MESRLGSCNAFDLAQLMFGLGAMYDGRMAGVAYPHSLLRAVEQYSCSMIPSFLPQVPLRQNHEAHHMPEYD